MKPRFTFQYPFNLLILNTFHQAQGMKPNSAVSCLFTIDCYQDHVSIVTYLLLMMAECTFLRQGRIPILTFSSLQLKMVECTKSARRARGGIAAFTATSVPLSTLSAAIAVDLAHLLCLCPIVFVA